MDVWLAALVALVAALLLFLGGMIVYATGWMRGFDRCGEIWRDSWDD